MKNRIARIKDKYYDMGTSNKSFLQLAQDLQLLGIKNFYFSLELKDPSLINIDPFAVDKNGHTTLSKDQISRVMMEITKNPWYFLREIARIPDQGGTAIPYKANRGNIAQAYCFVNGLDSWLCLTRQKGKTQSALAIEDWAYNFGTTNSQFIFVNKDGDNAKENLRRLTSQIDLLPEYLRFESYLDDEGKRTKARKNATRIEHPITHNSIIIKPKATSYDSALSLARGLTAPILHFDEPEFTNHIKTIVENSVSTFEQAAANAKRNNAMHGRIFTCTPGDLSTSMGQEGQMLIDKCAKWTERIYDMAPQEVEEYLLAQGENCNKIFYIEYSYKQIGETEEWFRDISAKIGNPLVVRREILLQRLHGSSASPYDQEDIEYIVSTEQKPIDELWLLNYYKFDIYEKLNPNIPYIVGVDCSSGTNRDNNAITILNPYTIQPVAEFECSFIGLTNFEKLLIELITTVIPRGVLCIERNNVGISVIDHLLETQVRNNLYFDKSKNIIEENMKNNESVTSILKKQAEMKTYYGVWTGTSSRESMFAILSRHVNEYKEKFITHNIIRDLTRLVITSSGKIVAGTGKDKEGDSFHDDSIMSYLIALYVYYHGNNLSLFGIKKGLQDNEKQNTGLRRADEINPNLVDPKLIEYVRQQENLNAEPTWDELLKNAIKNSQKESYSLHKKGLVDDNVFAYSDNSIDDSDYDDDIDLNMFNGLNGF